MRLDKFLSNALKKTRSEIRKLIQNKGFLVNSKLIYDASFKIDEEKDIVETLDKKTLKYNEYIYIVLNKPKGYISATYDKKDPIVLDLISKDDKFLNPFPVGRLDKDTEGLLILTNDGKFSHEILSPKKHVGKTYYVESKNNISDKDIDYLKNPLEIDDYITIPANVERIDNNKLYIEIFEGKFHQVKKMLEKINNKVVYLKRIKYGNFCLPEEIKIGEYKILTKEEIYEKIYDIRK